jgi:uncharacterized protein
MTDCFFVSDLHGREERYEKLFAAIADGRPEVVFVGGDLLPRKFKNRMGSEEFLDEYFRAKLLDLREKLSRAYPRIFLILGNDDARAYEDLIVGLAREELFEYMHERSTPLGEYTVYGYSYIPPSPFRLKDWERYDVSRYVEHGCIAPEDGVFTTEVLMHEIMHHTIKEQLDALAGDASMSHAVFLFHTPPHGTKLDRADLDGKMIDHAPVDVYVGSIAMRRFIEARQPHLTLHGHIHESARLTGSWQDRLGGTLMFNGSHDGAELSLIRFDLDNPASATRKLM